MRQLQWLLARTADKIGYTAALAWLLLIAIIAYAFYVFFPGQQSLLALEQKLQDIPPSQQVVYAYVSPSEHFFSKIPPVEQVTTSIQTLFDIAKKQRISINEVVYKDEQRPGEDIVRYSMSFSIVAAYPVIKTFVIDTLAALPYLALEQMSFERQQADSKMVSAHLQFTLYLVR